MKIIGLSGSLRRNSYNTALLNAAAELCPNGVELDVRTIHGIPLYDGDLEESEGVPEPVETLKRAIGEVDGLLLATPEYNNSIPGAFKNAIDWLSRPPSDIKHVFIGKPVAVIGTTPGGFGTNLAQNAWLPVLRTLKTNPWFGGRLMLAKAGDLFDADGTLTDEKTRERLADFLDGFAGFVRAQKD